MKHLLFDEHCFRILIDGLGFYNKKYNARTVAYVFMRNHIHFIVYFTERNFLSDYVRDFKKYTSIKIREYIGIGKPDLLEGLTYEHRTQHFKVWQDGFDDVMLCSKDVCEVKMAYIHNNPVKASLVDEPTKYRFSSAAFYWNWHPKINSVLLHYKYVF